MNQQDEQRFLEARRTVIRRCYQNLNDMQQQAVMTTQGPLLLLAGAGSGKTTVLIHRIANLIRFGRASDSEDIPGFVTEEDVDFLCDYAAHPTEEGQARAENGASCPVLSPRSPG